MLAGHPQGTGLASGLRACTASSQPSRQEGPVLTSQFTGYAVGGLGHGARPSGQGRPRISDEKL